jgi:hypothetical protein
MFYDITIWVIISLILIILIHYLFIFFKDTLTVPKVKDLIIQPEEKYKNIEIITREEEVITREEEGTTNINDLKQTSTKPITNDDNEMKNELKNFFNELKEQNNIDTNLNNNVKGNLDEKLFTEIR